MSTKRLIRSTTVLSVRRNGTVVLAGDGQVTLGESVIKHSAKKIRRLYNDKIVAGFAGSTADALAEHTQLSARQIAEEAMKIAGKICIYTNDKVTIEEL